MREQGMAEQSDEQRDVETQQAESTASEATSQGGDLNAQLATARDEAAQYKDKYLREYADKENFRKRQERMAEDRLRREKREMLERVLDVVDNLDRAMTYQETMDREGLQQTLRMLQWQLNEVLRAEGLTPVNAVGATFDPHVHEAVETIASAEHADGVVAEEVRKGYKMGDDLLRPARVKVSTGPNE